MTKPKSKRKVLRIEAEQGIPLPPIIRYPWDTMEVGESFLYQGKPISAGRHIDWAERQYGKSFTKRTEGSVTRIWRIDPNTLEKG
jgi:hypothetical protein